MTNLVFELVVMLFIILAASELFTNALEHLGEQLKISEGVTGSVFAAIGTAGHPHDAVIADRDAKHIGRKVTQRRAAIADRLAIDVPALCPNHRVDFSPWHEGQCRLPHDRGTWCNRAQWQQR